MRTLWRTTLSLLRQYPVLWLPVLLAEFVNLNLRRLDHLALRQLDLRLISWLSRDSVLSNAPSLATPSQEVVRKVVALTAPITYGFQLLTLFLSACALVATAAILRNITAKGPTTLRAAIPTVASSSSRILVFSLKLFGLNVVARLLIGFLAPLVRPLSLQADLERLLPLSLKSQLALQHSQLIPNLISYLWVLPITLAVVYLIAPLEVRLLQPPDSIPSAHQRNQARRAAIFAALTVCALRILIPTLESAFLQGSYLRTTAAGYSIETFTSMIGALPYIPLYVALYLIATPETLVDAAPAPQTADPPLPDLA